MGSPYDQAGMIPASQLPLAGIMERFVALLIDNILLYFVQAIVMAPLGMFSFNPNMTPDQMMAFLMGRFWGILFLGSLIPIAYFTYFIGSRGQTPGKMLMGVKVVTVDGDDVTYGAAFLRCVGYWVDGLLCGVGGYLFAFFNDDRRALHDFMAKTIVVSTR